MNNKQRKIFYIINALVLSVSFITLIIALFFEIPYVSQLRLVGNVFLFVSNTMSLCNPILRKSKKVIEYIMPAIGVILSAWLLWYYILTPLHAE